jgi:hypothetical protein
MAGGVQVATSLIRIGVNFFYPESETVSTVVETVSILTPLVTAKLGRRDCHKR